MKKNTRINIYLFKCVSMYIHAYNMTNEDEYKLTVKRYLQGQEVKWCSG